MISDTYWFWHSIGAVIIGASVAFYAIIGRLLHNIDVGYNLNIKAFREHLSSFEEDNLCDKIIFSMDKNYFKIVDENRVENVIFLMENLVGYPKNYLSAKKKLFKNAREFLKKTYKFDKSLPSNNMLEYLIVLTLNQILKRYIWFARLKHMEISFILLLIVGIVIQIISFKWF